MATLSRWFDLQRLELLSDPVPVVEGVQTSQPYGSQLQFATARDGSLFYLQQTVFEAKLVAVQRDGQATALWPLTCPHGLYHPLC